MFLAELQGKSGESKRNDNCVEDLSGCNVYSSANPFCKLIFPHMIQSTRKIVVSFPYCPGFDNYIPVCVFKCCPIVCPLAQNKSIARVINQKTDGKLGHACIMTHIVFRSFYLHLISRFLLIPLFLCF